MSTTTHLETLDNRTRYLPGEMVAGIAGWELDAVPDSVEVCLFWHTSGKGDCDVGVADRVTLTPLGPVDAQPYRLKIPAAPYSFSGRLITLTWSIELIVEPGHHVRRINLTVSPTGDEIALGSAGNDHHRPLIDFHES